MGGKEDIIMRDLATALDEILAIIPENWYVPATALRETRWQLEWAPPEAIPYFWGKVAEILSPYKKYYKSNRPDGLEWQDKMVDIFLRDDV
jgi:hypothetical protein